MTASVHIALHPDRPIAETADIAAEAERLRYAGVWIADSQNLFRDVFCALTLVAARTSDITIGTGVTNPVTRHPAVVAGAIGSIDELSAGRAALGIGTGETAVETLGRKRATLARMEEFTHTVRGLLAADTVPYDGADITMAWRGKTVPVLLASTGPRSLELAGRVADGVYLKLGSNPDIVRYALKHVTRGAQEAGRSLDSFRIQTLMPLAVDTDGAAAREEVKGFAAAIARAAVLAIPQEDVPEQLWSEIEELNRVSSAAREEQTYVEWLQSPQYRALITDEIVDSFAIAGTPSEVAARIEEISALGITDVVVPLITGDPWSPLQAIAQHVVPLTQSDAA